MRRARPAWAVALTVALVLADAAGGRPEKIRPGYSYFSDEATANGLVRDLVGEKNFEEVYQFYRYFEAVYDDAGRVTRFVEYERGETLVVERYRYGPDGALLERIAERPGQPPEITTRGDPDATGPDTADPKPRAP
jgi:hypothetical protein